MDSHKILSLLGLALRGNHLAVGEEPVEAAARAKDARLLLLASDAADNTRRTSAALVAVTDIGLANAVANRLAQLDEDQYGEAAERLALKAKRAAERQSELRAHEKNVRTGKYRPKPRRTPEDSSPQVEKSPPDRRPRNQNRSRPRRGSPTRSPHPYAHSRPVKKGKGSFRKRED